MNLIIERFNGGYFITAEKRTIIVTDEELRIADMAEKDDIPPMDEHKRKQHAKA